MTNRIIKPRRCTKLPITPSVIKQVHKIAAQEGMPLGLKITNRYDNVLFDAAWLAGVDYDEQEFQDKYEEDYETENEEEQDDDVEEDAYDRIEEEEIADILNKAPPQGITRDTQPQEQEPVVPQELEHEIIFKEDPNADADPDQPLFKDYDDNSYEPSDQEDIDLVYNDEAHQFSWCHHCGLRSSFPSNCLDQRFGKLSPTAHIGYCRRTFRYFGYQLSLVIGNGSICNR